jgi:hypothetical protein
MKKTKEEAYLQSAPQFLLINHNRDKIKTKIKWDDKFNQVRIDVKLRTETKQIPNKEILPTPNLIKRKKRKIRRIRYW